MAITWNSATSTLTLNASAGLGARVTGTGNITSSGSAVIGVGTAFTTQLAVNDYILTTGLTVNYFAKVTAIASATSLTIEVIGATPGFYDGVTYNNLTTSSAFICIRPARLSDLVTAVNNAEKLSKSTFGNSFTFNSLTFIHTGWLEIGDFESMNKQGSLIWTRDVGAGLILNSQAQIQITGVGAGVDPPTNTFRSNSSLLTKYNPVSRTRPIVNINTTTRSDDFSFFVSDENAGKMQVAMQGLILVNAGTQLCSHKIYYTASSFVNNLYFLTTNSSEFQLSLQTSLTLNNLVLQGSAISTSPGSSSASTLTLVSPTFIYATAGPYFYSNTNGGYGYTTVLLNPSFPLGEWNGFARAVTNGSTKLRVVFTQNIKYLQGVTPQQNMKTAFISTDATNAPSIFNVSSSAGITGSINLLRGLAQPTGTTQVLLPVITWSAYVKKPGKEISTPLYTAKQLTTPDDSTYQTSTDPESVLTDAQIISATPPYAGIAIDKATKTITLTSTNTAKNIYNGVLWFLYQNANMDYAQFASFVSNVGDFLDWNIVSIEFATGVIKTTGSVTATAAFVATVSGNVTQATPTNLTGVIITNNLTFNTNTPITVTFTNTTVSGTVSNSGTGLVTILLANSTVGTAGSNVTTQLVTSLSIASLLADSQIYVKNGTGAQVAYIASSTTSYNLDTTGGTGTWEWRVRKYGYEDQSGTFTPATSSESVVGAYLVDAFVVDTLTSVTAYTDLQTTQKIYDYSRYFATTNPGIALVAQFDKGFGTITANSALTLNPSAVALMAVSGGVTTKTSGLAENVTVVVTGNFTQGAATLSNDVRIRAANLDSELLFSGIDSLTIYATQSDALTNNSPGATSTTGIIRYEYGAVLSGVTMSGTVYVRTLFGTTVQVQAVTLVAGTTILDLSTSALLQSVLTNVENVPEEVWTHNNRTINNALFT